MAVTVLTEKEVIKISKRKEKRGGAVIRDREKRREKGIERREREAARSGK